MAKIVNSAEELIGNTPLLRLKRSLEDIPTGRWLREQFPKVEAKDLRGNFKSELYAKVEFMNPGGSIKDRIALQMLNAAERSGKLKPGGTIVEATSGNTGAGLAVLAAIRGYKAIFVMPDKIASEKINALRAYGAKVVITPTAVPPESPDAYTNVATRLGREIPGAFHPNQYVNVDNQQAHYLTTGPEIWDQMDGKIDVLFAGIGTGGTLSGTAKFLKSKNPNLKAVAVDPYGSIYTGLIKQNKMTEFAPYLVEGVGEDMVPDSMDMKTPDDAVQIEDGESFAASRMLAQREGLLVGGSCGMAFYGAVQWLLAHETRGGTPLRSVVILPDSGSRYLSKVFNQPWLAAKSVARPWGEQALGGAVEYWQGAIPVVGV